MPLRCFTDGQLNEWQITLTTTAPPPPSPRQVTLRFRIDAAMGNRISGKVLQDGTEIADFTGTCRVVIADQVNRMSFEFPFSGRARFAVTGVTFTDETGGNVFVGTFRADPPTELRETKVAIVPPVPPESGDTGVGNGTQT